MPISVELAIVPFTGEAGQMNDIAAIMRDATARFEEPRSWRPASRPSPNRSAPLGANHPPEAAADNSPALPVYYFIFR